MAGKWILVCGGRHYEDEKRLFEVLDQLHAEDPIAGVYHGGASGADALAGKWAKQRNRPCIGFPAKWRLYGRAAGPTRNREMLRTVKDSLSLVVAFKGGAGTKDMVKLAKHHKVPVLMVDWEYKKGA